MTIYTADLCVALLLLAGCHSKSSDAAPPVLVTVQVAHPQTGVIVQHVWSDAVLSPLSQAAISPRISAPVQRFYVQRGTHVRAGELLATLDNRDLQASALDARGAYTVAQSAFDSTSGAQVPEEMESSRLAVAQAKATRDLDASVVQAREKLFSQGAVPGRDLDTAQATLVQAQAAYDVAVQHLAALEAVSRKATLQGAEGAVQSAKGRYLGAEAQVAYSEVRSPINGVVTDRPLFAGETAPAGTPLVTVMDTSSLLAKIHLAQNVAQDVKLGDTATVMIPGVKQPQQARVSLVSPALDPGSTTLQVWLQMDNRDGNLKVGTPVRTSVAGRADANALLIPAAALFNAQDGSRYVLVLSSGDTVKKRAVEAGILDGGQAEILRGLSSTDTVVTGGGYGLDDGTKVKVGPADGDEDAKPSPGESAGDK